MRRMASALSVIVMTAGMSLVGTAPAQAYVNTGKACNWRTYKSHSTVSVTSKAPKLTHVKQFSMSPGGKRTETKTVTHSTTLRAKVTYNSTMNIGATGLTKVIASASAKVNMGLAASGKHTTTKSVKITDVIVNKTGKNKAYVFFAGQTVVKGKFRYYFCEQSGGQDRRWTVRYVPGKWTSYGVAGQGAVRCGAGSQTSLQKLALKVGCA